MTHTAMLLACTLLFGGGDGAQPAKVRIVAKADALVRGGEILLRDLAQVETDDAVLTDRLLEVSFGRRPSFGFTRVLSAHDVLQRLVREGLAAEQLAVAGAREIVVQPLFAVLQAQDLLDVAEPALRAAIELDAGDVEFELATPLRTLRVPPGRQSLDLRAKLRNGTLQQSAALVDVSIIVDGEAHEVVPVQFRLRRFAQVLVTTQPISRGQALGEHNVEVRRLEAGYTTSPWLGAADAVLGKVAGRDLRAGERLALGALADPAVIHRGDQVSLVSTKGRVKVTTKAVAQQDGAVGDRVTVTNLTSGKAVQAVVEGVGVVSVGALQ